MEGIIKRMNDNIAETERKIEATQIEIEQISRKFKADPNMMVINFENLVSEVREVQNKKKMRSFLKSFIEKITVFYDKDKSEHKLVVHMKQSIIGNVKEFVLPSKKNLKRIIMPVQYDTPLLNNHVTVE